MMRSYILDAFTRTPWAILPERLNVLQEIVARHVAGEKLDAEEGVKVWFDEVLLVADGEKIEIGNPLIKGAKVEAEITKQGRGRKIIVFKYHAKTRYRKKKGHRQYFTEVKIVKIPS